MELGADHQVLVVHRHLDLGERTRRQAAEPLREPRHLEHVGVADHRREPEPLEQRVFVQEFDRGVAEFGHGRRRERRAVGLVGVDLALGQVAERDEFGSERRRHQLEAAAQAEHRESTGPDQAAHRCELVVGVPAGDRPVPADDDRGRLQPVQQFVGEPVVADEHAVLPGEVLEAVRHLRAQPGDLTTPLGRARRRVFVVDVDDHDAAPERTSARISRSLSASSGVSTGTENSIRSTRDA